MTRPSLARLLLATVAVAWLATGCDDTRDPVTANRPAPTAAKPRPTTYVKEPKPEPYADVDVPVPGDFEAELEQSITPANYEEALRKLHAEIHGEAAPVATATATAAQAPTPPP